MLKKESQTKKGVECCTHYGLDPISKTKPYVSSTSVGSEHVAPISSMGTISFLFSFPEKPKRKVKEPPHEERMSRGFKNRASQKLWSLM